MSLRTILIAVAMLWAGADGLQAQATAQASAIRNHSRPRARRSHWRRDREQETAWDRPGHRRLAHSDDGSRKRCG